MKMIPCVWNNNGTSSLLTVCGRLVGGVYVNIVDKFWADVANDYNRNANRMPDMFNTRDEAKRAVEQALGVREIGEGD